jgi:hypothetical protein
MKMVTAHVGRGYLALAGHGKCAVYGVGGLRQNGTNDLLAVRKMVVEVARTDREVGRNVIRGNGVGPAFVEEFQTRFDDPGAVSHG